MTRRKLTIENGMTCNRDQLVLIKNLSKNVLESVHDDVHCGITAIQKQFKLEA